MNKHPKNELPVIGACSLITIFAVLCLITFALLSISTVQANECLGSKSREMFTAYYAAECRAEEILAQLRAQAAGSFASAQTTELPETVSYRNGIYTYSCPITDTCSLEVAVTIQGDNYEILRWCMTSGVVWEANESLPVWNGL